MDASVKVRFAPSPTGFLHIGGVRTALFNWLFARHHGGKFVLRIEDTDVSRSTEESIQEIIQAMQWLGLDWDEGPYRQMERQDIYKEKVEVLLREGNAYRCYCAPEDLETRRQEAQKKGLKPKYDGTCRNRTDRPEKLPSVVRFKTPLEGTVAVHDLLRGQIIFDNQELDDFIIQRTDGTPTYNFVVVVDDADMAITHVIRGDDHLSNTPRQALMYEALNHPLPKFAHISMILGADKTRLSKRHGATSILAYRDMGYLPDAAINYLVRLGWSHGDQEIFSRDELIQHFSLENITTSAAVFNPEKLTWVNQQYIQKTPPLELAPHWEPILVQEGLLPKDHGLSLEEIAKPIPSLNQRAETLVEMAFKSEFYFKKELQFDEKARAKFLTPEARPNLQLLVSRLSILNDFSESTLEATFKEIVEQEGIKLGKLAQPVRIALTGKKESPGIYEVLSLLGRDTTLSRLKDAITWIDSL
ncbi:MAG: glutamate--tRNA ligase [Nitrospinaceae bacterium]|nr:MAG: glutamate--tRNA ligase [Nitrospinaceae bacterium]